MHYFLANLYSMQMSFVNKNWLLVVMIFALIFVSNAFGQQKTKNEATTAEICSTMDNFLKSLLEAKIQYERDLYHRDSSRVKEDRKVYFGIVAAMKGQKAAYLKCLNVSLINHYHLKGGFVQFVYYPAYLNTIPKCGLISYEEYIRILMYNLESVDNKEFDLKCKQ